MGDFVSKIVNRLFDYPIKKKPISFYLQDDFSSSGEPLPKEGSTHHGPLSEYDRLVQSFCNRLVDKRQQVLDNVHLGAARIQSLFPGWNELTVNNLHSLFLLFDKNSNGMLNYDDFSSLLESLDDDSTSEYRKQKFDEADSDMNGWINYDEFLYAVYHMHPKDKGELNGLARKCLDAAENIRFIESLSVGEQLECGLF